MNAEVREAVRRLNERKLALGGAHEARPMREDEHLALFSGFDLDPDELRQLDVSAVHHGLKLLDQGASPQTIFATLLMEGMLIGLLVADARQREGAA